MQNKNNEYILPLSARIAIIIFLFLIFIIAINIAMMPTYLNTNKSHTPTLDDMFEARFGVKTIDELFEARFGTRSLGVAALNCGCYKYKGKIKNKVTNNKINNKINNKTNDNKIKNYLKQHPNTLKLIHEKIINNMKNNKKAEINHNYNYKINTGGIK